MISETENSLSQKVIKLKWYQEAFLFSPFKIKFLVGGWGSGKTLAGILAIVQESESVKNNLGLVLRKEFVDLKDSTIKDFESLTKIKLDSGRNATVGKSTVMFRHAEEIEKGGLLQNINLGWCLIEQAEEFDSDSVLTAVIGRVRREPSNRKIYCLANARGKNWIYNLRQKGIYDEQKKRLDAHYLATTSDNADNLPTDYLSMLETLKTRNPKVYKRFVENSCEDGGMVDIVIESELVRAASERTLHTGAPVYRVVSVDVARYGDDKTVLYAIENNRVTGKEEWEKKSTMETVGLAQIFARKHNIKAFAVDEIGVGAGVVDRLSELGLEVIAVNSSRASVVPKQYYNLRAEIYATGADKFQDGRVQIDKSDTDLVDQLSWARYKSIKSSGLLQVEAKEDIKKRHGRSPDNADAFLNGLWALTQTKQVGETVRSVFQGGWVHPRFRVREILPAPHREVYA